MNLLSITQLSVSTKAIRSLKKNEEEKKVLSDSNFKIIKIHKNRFSNWPY